MMQAKITIANELNDICEAGGRGAQARIARKVGVPDSRIMVWRRGGGVSWQYRRILDGAITTMKQELVFMHARKLHPYGSDHTADPTEPSPINASEIAVAAKIRVSTKQNLEFRVRSFVELASLKSAMPEYVMQPWLPMQSIAMIYAWRGTGKSLFALSLAVSIAAGETFLKWPVPKSRSVIYIDGEMSLADLSLRYQNLTEMMGFEPVNGQLKLVSMMDPEQLVRLNLTNRQHHEAIRLAVGDAEVIVLDSSVSLWEGKEAEAWPVVQSFMLDMRRLGRTIIWLHQSGKDGEQRDVSDHEDLLNTSIKLKALVKHRDRAAFQISFAKHRGFFGPDAEPFSAALGSEGWITGNVASRQDGTSAPANGASPQHVDRVLCSLLQFLSDHGQSAASELALEDGAIVVEKGAFRDAYGDQWRTPDGNLRAAGTIRRTVDRALKDAEARGQIRIVTRGPKSWLANAKAAAP